MKLIGTFSDLDNIPEGFKEFRGIFAPEEPAHTLTSGGTTLILLGNVYGMPDGISFVNHKEHTLQFILDLYRIYDEKGLQQIDGDFTLIIREKDTLKIYRDFKGTGPQIFYSDRYFSNDLKLLLQLEKKKLEPDLNALSFFLKFGFIPPDKSGIKGIQRLKGGSYLQKQKGEPVAVRLPDPVKPTLESNGNGSAQDYSQMYFNLHTDAIRRRIDNKGKIGLLLSGGYDSGGNLAGIREIYDGELTSYTISFKNNPHSELEFTQIMAAEFNSTLKHYEIDGSEIKFLPEIVATTGVPFQESGLMINYLVMKMAAKDDPEMVLGGDGNDQLFGTAAKELALKWFTNVTGLTIAQKLINGFAGEAESGNFFRKVNFYNRKIDKVVFPDRWGFNDKQLKYATQEKNTIQIDPVFTTSFDRLYENRRINVDLAHTAFNVILFKASRMAELFGVPLSYPYLSKPVFDFVSELPVNYKIRGSMNDLLKGRGISKFIHKETYKHRMPQKITSRKKQGGFVPLSMFFRNKERNREFFRIIENSSLLDELLTDKRATISTLDKSLSDGNIWFWYQQVYYSRMFNLLVLALWEKIFMNRETITTI